MATPLYLQSAAPVNGARGQNDGGWIAYDGGGLDQLVIYGLETSRGGGVTSLVGGTADGPITVDLAPSSIPRCWLSRPLSAAVTISGTITFNIWALESAMAANATLRVKVFQISNVGAIGATIADSTWGTELGTSDAARNWTVTATSTDMAKGERIMVVLFATDATSVTMAAGQTWTVNFAGGSAGASGDTYVQFNETLTFSTSAPGGSTYYLTDTSSSVSVGLDYSEKALSTSRGGGAVNTLMRSVTGTGSPTYAKMWPPSGDPTVWQAVAGTSPSSEGYNFPASGSSIDDTAGPAWTNPGNITAKDGNVAYVFLPGVEYDTLRATNFGFTSCTGKILGYKQRVKGYVSSDLGAGETQQRIYFHDELKSDNGSILFTLPIGAGNSADVEVDNSNGAGMNVDERAEASHYRDNTAFYTEASDQAVVQNQQYNIDSVELMLYYLPWIEWYTPRLLGFTLSGIVRCNLRAKWVNGIITPICGMAAEVAVVNSNGSSAQVFGRQAMASALTTAEAAYTIDVAGSDITLTDGQRLRLRISLSPYTSHMPASTVSFPADALLYYAGAEGATGDSYVILPQTVTEAPPIVELRAPAITFQDPAVM